MKHYLTHLELYFNQLEKLNIREKVIIKKDAKILEQARTTQYRFLPKQTIGNTAFEVYDNKVAIFLWGQPHHLILIENKEVAESYTNQFEILWKNARRRWGNVNAQKTFKYFRNYIIISKSKDVKMPERDKKIPILQIIAWIIGFIGLGILIYGIIRALTI